ncbi:hypothetical protein IWW57_004411, partial [Coemansia sp. S610]
MINRQPPGVSPTTTRTNSRPLIQTGAAPMDHSRHSAYYTGNVTSATSHDLPAYSSGVSGTGSSASCHVSDSEKGALFASRSVTHTRTAPQERAMLPSSSSDPFVQTDNRLTEEYSRRIHCYISDTQCDSSTPRDHMPPPVLPPLASLRSEQEMPFWRPPRVLQRDPHYNQAVAYHSNALPQRFQSLTDHAATRGPALNPRHRAYGSFAQCRPTAPQVPTSGHLLHGIASNPAAVASSIHSSAGRSSQHEPNHPSWRMCSAESSAAPAHNSTFRTHSLDTDSMVTAESLDVVVPRHCLVDDDDSDTAAADYSSSNSNEYDIDVAATKDPFACGKVLLSDGFPASAKSPELRLRPIGRCHTAAREPMSIACLVDAEDSACSVVLPQISHLVSPGSSSSSSSRHLSALALSQLRRSTGGPHSVQQPYVSPTSPRKRSYGAAEAAMSLHKMARVETMPPPADVAADAPFQPAA